MKKRSFILQCYDVEAVISIEGEKKEVRFSRTHKGYIKSCLIFMKSIIAYELDIEDYRSIYIESGKLVRKTITIDTYLETISDIEKEVVYKC